VTGSENSRRTLHPIPPSPYSTTFLRTCIACKRSAGPIEIEDVKDPDAMRRIWAALAAEGWHTDSRGNQRCKDCPEDYPPEIGSLRRGVPDS
jgi:hypothetical protein